MAQMNQLFDSDTAKKSVDKLDIDITGYLKEEDAEIECFKKFIQDILFQQLSDRNTIDNFYYVYKFILSRYSESSTNYISAYQNLNCLSALTSREPTRDEFIISELENRIDKEDLLLDVYEFFDDLISENIFKRLEQLYKYRQETGFSIESLKTMLLFLYKSRIKAKQTITIDDSGIFHCQWHSKREDVFIFIFYEDRSAEYLFFKNTINPKAKPYHRSGFGPIEEIIENEINKKVFDELILDVT